MINATVLMDTKRYIDLGVQGLGLSCKEWSNKFTDLGGRECSTTAGWAKDNFPRTAKYTAIDFVGSQEALDFVIASSR